MNARMEPDGKKAAGFRAMAAAVFPGFGDQLLSGISRIRTLLHRSNRVPSPVLGIRLVVARPWWASRQRMPSTWQDRRAAPARVVTRSDTGTQMCLAPHLTSPLPVKK